MQWVYFCSIFFLFTACSGKKIVFDSLEPRNIANTNAPSISLPENWNLVWHDEFVGNSLDSSKWKILNRVRDDAINDSSTVQVSNGLKITTYSDGVGTHTGFLSTQGIFQRTYGYFEASIKFNGSSGEWCAFWLQSPTTGNPVGSPESAGVEIDITEHRAVNNKGTIISNKASMGALHWDGYGAAAKNAASNLVGTSDGSNLQGNFHTYGALWNSEGYQFYLDGKLVMTHPSTEVPVAATSEFIYLSCEVRDKGWAGDIPSGGYGQQSESNTGMKIQWVRVWGQN